MYVCLRTCTRIHERVLVHSHRLSGVIRRGAGSGCFVCIGTAKVGVVSRKSQDHMLTHAELCWLIMSGLGCKQQQPGTGKRWSEPHA